MSEQFTGREDRPATGQDFTNLRTEMHSEFRAVRAEMRTELSDLKLWLITRVAIISLVGGLSVVTGLGIAILLKI